MVQINFFDPRKAKLFKNRRNQAVRIPVDLEFDATVEQVNIHREGDRLIIEPVRENKLVALLDSWQLLDEEFPEIKDEIATPEEIF